MLLLKLSHFIYLPSLEVSLIRLKAALIYESKDKYLKTLLIICLFSSIIVEGSPIWPTVNCLVIGSWPNNGAR